MHRTEVVQLLAEKLVLLSEEYYSRDAAHVKAYEIYETYEMYGAFNGDVIAHHKRDGTFKKHLIVYAGIGHTYGCIRTAPEFKTGGYDVEHTQFVGFPAPDWEVIEENSIYHKWMEEILNK